MTANKTRPVQATAPKCIYLQGGPQLPENIDFSALSEVTWCRDDVDGTGIPYVRADLAGAAPAAAAGVARAGWRLVPATPTRDWIAAVADDGYFDVDCAQMIANILSHAPAAPALEAPAAPSRFDVNELAQLLFDAWAKAEPEHSVTRHPMSYWASFCDMARAALAAAPQAPAAPVAAAIPDAAYCALQYVEHALAAIANREELADGAFQPMDSIGKASKRAKAALARLQSVAHHFSAAAAPAAPAVDADPLGLRDVGEAFMQAIERNSDALKAVGWLGPMDCPSEIVVDLLNMLEEANTTSALGEWVATLEVDSGGGLDYETVPPCTLPPGCYPLYRAAQAAAKGA